MSNFSGISATILTISAIALLTIQLLKDKFEIVENYNENDEQGNYLNPYTAQNINNNTLQEIKQPTPVINNLENIPPHSNTPFVTGDSFRPAFVAPNSNANGWNNFSEAYAMYQTQVMAATPTFEQLDLISTNTLPGPNTFSNDSFVSANINSGRSSNLSLCSQNMSTFAVGNSAVASSLLPQNEKVFNEQLEGFSDCNVTNVLANQVFLTPSAQLGTDSSGSLRNSNLSLRSEPPNPVLMVGPWNLSTRYPDLLRKPLEGCGPSFGLYGSGPYSAQVPVKINE